MHINPQYPPLGASPDGLISCAYYGNGLLEIKCLYGKRNEDPEVIADSSFYLKHTENGLKLSESQEVQGQMAIFERSYCDVSLMRSTLNETKGILFTFSTLNPT